jgi:pyruvate ferredoxin oxidoreductase alpha subunit
MPDIRPDVDGYTAPGYMDIRHSLHMDLRTAVDEVVAIDREYQDLFGRGGTPLVESYCCDDAEVVAISLGSLSYQLRSVVDVLREEGLKVGSVGLRLYRPFPDQAIVELLSDKKRVVVFEKAISYGNQGPLYSDIKSALYRQTTRPEMENCILGIGGRTIKTKVLMSILRDICQGSDVESDDPRFIGIRLIGNRK